METRRRFIGTILLFLGAVVGAIVTQIDQIDDEDQTQPEPDEKEESDEETDQTHPTAEDESVLNVLDYGAVGDGSADDTQAIQAAIDDATDGETVYLPAGTYSIDRTGNERSVLRIDGDRHANDLTVTGDGSETVLELSDDIADSYYVLSVANPEDYSLLLRDMILDGNRDSWDKEFGTGHGLVFRQPDADGPGDIVAEDIEVRNCGQIGIIVQYGGVTLRRVTSHHNYRHGIAVTTTKSGVHDPPPKLQRCHIYQNGLMGDSGRGLNFHGGKGVVEDTVIEGNQGSGGTKISTEAIEFTYRRVRVQNCDSREIYQTTNPPEGAKVTFEDFIGQNNTGYMRVANAYHHVPENSELVITNCGRDVTEEGQLFITGDAAFEADGDVYSNRANGLAGISAWNVSESSYIRNYYHYGNDGGPIGRLDNLLVENEENRDRTDIANVPTARFVGAWSRPVRFPPVPG
jgi:hypothetical protein